MTPCVIDFLWYWQCELRLFRCTALVQCTWVQPDMAALIEGPAQLREQRLTQILQLSSGIWDQDWPLHLSKGLVAPRQFQGDLNRPLISHIRLPTTVLRESLEFSSFHPQAPWKKLSGFAPAWNEHPRPRQVRKAVDFPDVGVTPGSRNQRAV